MTAAQFFNQNSFLIGVIAVLGGTLTLFIVRRARRSAWLIWIAAAAIALSAHFALRTVGPRAFESAGEVQEAVAAGKPTLVEFYSNY